MSSKQVLVMRKMAKGCRHGKYCAQAAHASLGALLSLSSIEDDNLVIPLKDPFIWEWITGNFKKVAVYVDDDQQLVELYKQAVQAGLPAALIKDAGLTEFNGVATLTAVGIGPGDEAVINKITGHLPLF